MTTVLLTGATGFIGGAVLAHGLTQIPAIRWVCLVRGSSPRRARARLLDNLARFMGLEAARTALARVEIVVGDVTRPESLEDARLDGVTHILHLAADTSFRAREHCHLVNVGGTRALAERARRMPDLARFIFGGTAMICGDRPGPLVRETDYPSVAVEHLVAYTESKVTAERMLRGEFADLPVVIARPSIVAGHRRLGCIPSSSIFWMFRAGDRLRLVAGDPNGGIDIVPVDWAAEVLLGLLLKPDLEHDLYHVSAGTAKQTRWTALADAFDQFDPQDTPRVYTSFDENDWRTLRTRFAAAFGLDRPLHVAMLRAMRAYYRFSALGVAFTNDRLLGEGFPPPPALTEYLPACLSLPAGTTIPDQFAEDLVMFEEEAAPSVSPVAA